MRQLRKIRKSTMFLIAAVACVALMFGLFWYLNKQAERYPEPPANPYNHLGRSIPEDSNAYFDIVEIEKIFLGEIEPDSGIEQRIDDHVAKQEWDDSFVFDTMRRYERALALFDSAGTYGPTWAFQDPSLETLEEIVREDSTFPAEALTRATKLVALKAMFLHRTGKHKEAFDEILKILTFAQKMRNSEGDIKIFLAHVAVRRIALETLSGFIADTNLSNGELALYNGHLNNFESGRLPFTAAWMAYIRAAAAVDVSRAGGESMEPLRSIVAAFPQAQEYAFWYSPNATKTMLFNRASEVVVKLEQPCDPSLPPDKPHTSSVPQTFLERFKVYSTENSIGRLYIEAQEPLWQEFIGAYCRDQLLLKSLEEQIIAKQDLPTPFNRADYRGTITKDAEGKNVYTSSKLALRFTFPNGWHVGDNTLGNGTLQFFNYDHENIGPRDWFSPYGEHMNKIEAMVAVVDAHERSDIDLEKWRQMTDIRIAGQSAKRIDVQYEYGGEVRSYSIPLPSKPGQFLSITIHGDPSNFGVLDKLVESLEWI